MAFGLYLLLRSPVKLTQDSKEFIAALNTWHPVITAACPTTRMVKRYLNWVRFLAMCYRPRDEEAPGPVLRLLRRWGWAQTPAETSGDKAFDEDILVALSAIYQYRREWVLDVKKFQQLSDNGSVYLFREEQRKQHVQKAHGKQKEHIEPKSIGLFFYFAPEDWQRAAEQRPRFLEAIGDVEVA